jgi:hypothetical protein
MKTLAVFDFDDTLFRSGSRVIVKSEKRKTPRFLSSHEYAVHVPKPGEQFDFSEFDSYPRKPEPIVDTVELLKIHVAEYGLQNVIILTARGSRGPVEKTLENFELPSVFVAAVGTSNPQAKAEYVKRTIEAENYDRVIVYEDSDKNITAIKQAVEDLLGPGSCEAFKVLHGSKVTKVTEGQQAVRFLRRSPLPHFQ